MNKLNSELFELGLIRKAILKVTQWDPKVRQASNKLSVLKISLKYWNDTLTKLISPISIFKLPTDHTGLKGQSAALSGAHRCALKAKSTGDLEIWPEGLSKKPTSSG